MNNQRKQCCQRGRNVANMKLYSVRSGSTFQTDVFLETFNRVFSIARYIGISSPGPGRFFVWTVVVFLSLGVIVVSALWKVIRELAGVARHTSEGQGLMSRLSGFIFYSNGCLSLIFSIKFITSWRNLSYHWYKANTTGFEVPPDLNIRRRMIVITIFVSICALKDYSLWNAIPIFFVSKVATALWNFQDLIIILISIGLASRYHRLNTFVKQAIRREKRDLDIVKYGTESYLQVQVWRRVREAYVRQATLVRKVDHQLGALVLLSNVNNLYFICLQLFLGIGKISGTFINRAYYFLSLGWLLLRACMVVLAASDIYTHSTMALSSLYKCTASSYNIEIKRLINQLTNDDVALTGMGFFNLNRKLMLQVAAAILKYELVLIQYDSN